jgi:hypothetical protein
MPTRIKLLLGRRPPPCGGVGGRHVAGDGFWSRPGGAGRAEVIETTSAIGAPPGRVVAGNAYTSRMTPGTDVADRPRVTADAG